MREGGITTPVPAPTVAASDATAAGDAFCGALADAIHRGLPLAEAAAWGVWAGAVTATRPGAQASLPTRAELENAVEARGGDSP